MEPTTVLEAINAFKSVYDFLKETKKFLEKSDKRRWRLGSKKSEAVERKFKEALMGSKIAIEYNIWYGKGFAIASECGKKVDKEFHFLMGILAKIFNDISMRLDAEKLDEKLVGHIIGQLKVLEEYAQHFWNLQGIDSHDDKEKRAIKIIENFRGRLWDFQRSMEPYLTPEEH